MWVKSSTRLVNLDEIALIETRRSVAGGEEYSIDAYHAGENESPRITLFEVSGLNAREECDSVYDLICSSVAEGRRMLDISDRVVTPSE